MKNADKPINPSFISLTEDKKPFLASPTAADNGLYYETSLGLTKREYFAGLAMQGLINSVNSPSFIAEKAVKLADELLQKLENK